jgi:hypothetical protein
MKIRYFFVAVIILMSVALGSPSLSLGQENVYMDKGDFLVRRVLGPPVIVLNTKVLNTQARREPMVRMKLQNVSSKNINYIEFGVSRTCSGDYRGADITLGEPKGFQLKANHIISIAIRQSDNLKALLKASSDKSCKPQLTIHLVKFVDGGVWRPYIETIL